MKNLFLNILAVLGLSVAAVGNDYGIWCGDNSSTSSRHLSLVDRSTFTELATYTRNNVNLMGGYTTPEWKETRRVAVIEVPDGAEVYMIYQDTVSGFNFIDKLTSDGSNLVFHSTIALPNIAGGAGTNYRLDIGQSIISVANRYLCVAGGIIAHPIVYDTITSTWTPVTGGSTVQIIKTRREMVALNGNIACYLEGGPNFLTNQFNYVTFFDASTATVTNTYRAFPTMPPIPQRETLNWSLMSRSGIVWYTQIEYVPDTTDPNWPFGFDHYYTIIAGNGIAPFIAHFPDRTGALSVIGSLSVPINYIYTADINTTSILIGTAMKNRTGGPNPNQGADPTALLISPFTHFPGLHNVPNTGSRSVRHATGGMFTVLSDLSDNTVGCDLTNKFGLFVTVPSAHWPAEFWDEWPGDRQYMISSNDANRNQLREYDSNTNPITIRSVTLSNMTVCVGGATFSI